MKSKVRLAVGLGLGLALLGFLAYASTTNILGVGALPYSELVNGPAQVTMRQFLSQPEEVGGWHYHPGLVLSVVTSGAVTVEDGCGGEETFSTGQAFEKVGGRVHRWKNLGAVPAVEYYTFVVPQGSPLGSFTSGAPLWSAEKCQRVQIRRLAGVHSSSQLHESGGLRSVRSQGAVDE